MDVYDRPVPGRPTVFRVPWGPTVTLAPLGPMLALTPLLLRFILIPGAIFMDRLNRKPITNIS